MNFNTKYFPTITKFILLFCVGFFLVGAISSCKKKGDNVSSKGFAGIIQAGVIPTDDSYIDPLAKDVFSYYTAGATLITKYLSPAGTGDGSSWSKAQGNLQKLLDGITDAASNKIYLILLAKGEYKAGAEISMKNNIAIVGGFTAKDDDDYTQSTTETTLSGNGQYRVFYNKGGIDNTALLYGVKITEGKITNNGGGMLNDNSSPIISHVTFSQNTSDGLNGGKGGGMSNYNNSSPILTHVTFTGNKATEGGGMLNGNNSSPILNYVTFTGNTADDGGGMFNYSSAPILTHVTFAGNAASNYGGGGMSNNNSSPILSYVTFTGNTTTYGGGTGAGGIFNSGTSSVLIASSILWGNTLNGSAQQIYNEGGNNVSLYNSVLQGGKGSIAGTGTTNYDVSSMIETDPGLGTLAGNGGFVQTISISQGSSAKDRGLYVKRSGNTVYFSNDNTSWFTIDASTGAKTTATPPTDAIDLSTADARGYKITDKPDAGAYEYGATAP